MNSFRTAPPTLSSPVSLRLGAQGLESSRSSWSSLTGITDKVFAGVSIALVVVACVIGLLTWTEPGWTQIASFALMFLLVRGLVGCLFAPGEQR